MNDLMPDRADLRVLPRPAADEHLVEPADVGLADLPLTVIMAAHQSATQRLEHSARGITRRPTAADVHDTVIALQAGRVVVDRLLVGLWPTIRDGLAWGATVADLAEAAGLGEVELVCELGGWADRELEADRMSSEEHEQTVVLIGTAVAVERNRLRRTSGGAR